MEPDLDRRDLICQNFRGCVFQLLCSPFCRQAAPSRHKQVTEPKQRVAITRPDAFSRRHKHAAGEEVTSAWGIAKRRGSDRSEPDGKYSYLIKGRLGDDRLGQERLSWFSWAPFLSA